MQVVLRTDFHCSDVESGSLAMLWMNTVCESLIIIIESLERKSNS